MQNLVVKLKIGLLLLLLSTAAPVPLEAQQCVISTVAGGVPPSTPVRGVELPINTRGVATDATGNVYFTSTLDCVFKLDHDRLRFGFSEWNALGYYAEDISPLLNLVDFCLDEEIQTRSQRGFAAN